MPKKYEKIRNNYVRAGASKKEASSKAAATYNKQRKKGQKSVTRGMHK